MFDGVQSENLPYFLSPVTPSFCGAKQSSCFLTYLCKDIFYAHINKYVYTVLPTLPKW